MSLFIWNDRRWQLIKENDEYDNENYCIVRKLFIRWLKSSDPTAINTAITTAFSEFGEVESVESVTSSTFRAQPDVYEAYVLFKRSEDAYKAFIANRDKKKSSEEVITVLPVNTWKVRPPLSRDAELAEMSRRISKIEDKDDYIQFIYKMCITPGMLLRVFRMYMRRSKEFLTGLTLTFGPDDSSDDEFDFEATDLEVENVTEGTEEIKETEGAAGTEPGQAENSEQTEEEKNCLTEDEFEKRLSEVLVKNIGPKFTALTIDRNGIPMERLQWLAPVLRKIKMLKLHIEYDCSILYVLHGYCPNLTTFHLDGLEWDGEYQMYPAMKWPSLVDLFVNVSDMDDDEICEEGNRKLDWFLEKNPQLISLQIESIIDLETVAIIGRTLKHLTTLAIMRPSFEGLNSVLDTVSGLTKLHALKLSAYAVAKRDLNNIIKCTKRLGRLPELRLFTIFLNCEPDTQEEEDFMHLKEFYITHHQNCKCHGPNRTLSFEEHDIEVPNDSSVLVLVVNTKPPGLSQDKALRAGILKAFKKTNKFFPNIIRQIERTEGENCVFIQISSNRF